MDADWLASVGPDAIGFFVDRSLQGWGFEDERFAEWLDGAWLIPLLLSFKPSAPTPWEAAWSTLVEPMCSIRLD